MSHYTRMRTKLSDLQVLAAALREVGYLEVEVHETAQVLHGWGGVTASAVVIVRREHASAFADFGFARQPDGSFDVIIDDLDRQRNGPQWLPRLTQAYGHAAALKYAADHGYNVITDEAEQDGTRRLTLRRPN